LRPRMDLASSRLPQIATDIIDVCVCVICVCVMCVCVCAVCENEARLALL
jgi:hypothetical protein